MLVTKSWGILLATVLTTTGFCAEPCKSAQKFGVPCNGISVGAPKVFDRSLTLMMETLSQQLSAQQKGLIDQKTLVNFSTAFGTPDSKKSANLG
jgi:hypothetical protein